MIHWGFPPLIGGVETHLSLLCPELVRMGHEVALLTGTVDNSPEKEIWNGISIWRHDLMDLNGIQSINAGGLLQRAIEVFKEFIDIYQPEIIHAHNLHYFFLEHALGLKYVCERNGIPIVMTAHNVWYDDIGKIFSRFIKWDRVIAVSKFVKNALIKQGVDSHEIDVVYHGIDLNKYDINIVQDAIFDRYPILQNKTIVFHPARMSKEKGTHISIKAARLIKQRFKDTILVLSGSSMILDWNFRREKSMDFFKTLIIKEGMTKSILIDTFRDEDMPLIYKAAEVTMSPTILDEAFGITMLESLAMGTPMVVSRSGGMPEVIKDGFNGFIVDKNDPIALAERCIEILSNDDLRCELGRNGRRLIEEKFTKETMAKNTVKVYERVLGKL